MKKYLFGLGAVLVGAGLMFMLMHGEVSADSRPKPFTCSIELDSPEVSYRPAGNVRHEIVYHCETENLDCGTVRGNISCVKK